MKVICEFMTLTFVSQQKQANRIFMWPHEVATILLLAMLAPLIFSVACPLMFLE